MKLTVRSRRVAKAVTIPFRLVSSEEPGESFLRLTPSSFKASAGARSTSTVTITNLGEKRLRSVELMVVGLDSAYYVVETAPQDIEASQSAQYQLSFYLPAGYDGPKNFALRGRSAVDQESVKVNASLELEYLPVTGLGFTVSNVQYYGGREVVVSVVVSNDGTTPLRGVEPSAGGLQVTAQPARLDLNPGESKSMTLSFSSPSSDKQTVPLKFKSDDGVESELVQLGVEAPQQQAGFPWMLVAVIALVILLLAYAFLGRREAEPQLLPPGELEEEPKFEEVEEAKLEDFDESEK